MRELEMSADALISALLRLAADKPVCILDSCGVGHLGSHLLIAGIRPIEVTEISNDDPIVTLRILDDQLSLDSAAIFTMSYDFGVKVQRKATHLFPSGEPDLFIARFGALAVHDYDTSRTVLIGSDASCRELAGALADVKQSADDELSRESAVVNSNFTRDEYIRAVEEIREHIRRGDTYQTNLTMQLRCKLAPGSTPETIFTRLRRDHPAPFAAFLRRPGSAVVSASPERFLRIGRDSTISASPIKGTRPRGENREDDLRLRRELAASEKDRAENTMIVDLMRNDLGRVCEFGSVEVEKLCDIEEHPTLFHLVSTVRGKLRPDLRFSEIVRAVFPCGSITGAPKIRTMEIIADIEKTARGLSMGAIGLYLPSSWDREDVLSDTRFDLSVAIRTMTIRNGEAIFNVGGGVVIDSDPEKEFDEAVLKAKALLNAIRGTFPETSRVGNTSDTSGV